MMAGIVQRGRAVLRSLVQAGSASTSPVAVASSESLVVPAGARSGYMRGGMGSPFLLRWFPMLRDAADEVRQSWVTATARAEDLIRNSGWITGGVRSAVGSVIGDGLRLSPRPDTTVIKFDGLTDDDGNPIDADGWIRFVKRRWQAYTDNPANIDARGIQTFAQMQIAAFKCWLATGEIVALVPYRDDGYGEPGPKVQLVPPHRLSQKTSTLQRIFQGVRFDALARPEAYVFNMRGANGLNQELTILARDGAGRPQVIHVFEAMPTQVRGITPLVPVLEVCKKADQLDGATLMSALLQTIFSATVESDLPTMEVLQGLSSADSQGMAGGIDDFVAARMGWNLTNGLDLGSDNQARIAHLFPGEKLKFNRSEHPNTTYDVFKKNLLREAAKGFGVTFSQLTGDYTGVTYTGVRMEGTDNWQITLDRRHNIAARFCQPPYEAFLEDQIERGIIKFPGGLEGFLENREAACRARWLGPPKPAADDVKQANVHKAYREMGVMSDEEIAAERGAEIDDVYAARQREANLRRQYGLADNGPSLQIAVAEIGSAARAETDAEETDPDEQEPAET